MSVKNCHSLFNNLSIQQEYALFKSLHTLFVLGSGDTSVQTRFMKNLNRIYIRSAVDITSPGLITTDEFCSLFKNSTLAVSVVQVLTVANCLSIDGQVESRQDYLNEIKKNIITQKDLIMQVELFCTNFFNKHKFTNGGIGLFRRDLMELKCQLAIKNVISLAKETISSAPQVNTALAQKYLKLETCRDETLGKAFYKFYRDRGFKFPGELDGGDESAVNHDSLHILVGANTDNAGEMIMAAVEAGMSRKRINKDVISERIARFYEQFLNLDIPNNPKTSEAIKKYCINKGIDLGKKINEDLVASFDFWGNYQRNTKELRRYYNIEGIEIINIPCDLGSKSFYWNKFDQNKLLGLQNS